jgi:hypothetical protein
VTLPPDAARLHRQGIAALADARGLWGHDGELAEHSASRASHRALDLLSRAAAIVGCSPLELPGMCLGPPLPARCELCGGEPHEPREIDMGPFALSVITCPAVPPGAIQISTRASGRGRHHPHIPPPDANGAPHH